MSIKIQRHETMKYGGIKLYAGRSCPELAQKIADYLQIPLIQYLFKST
jgi:hypothetical protein